MIRMRMMVNLLLFMFFVKDSVKFGCILVFMV